MQTLQYQCFTETMIVLHLQVSPLPKPQTSLPPLPLYDQPPTSPIYSPDNARGSIYFPRSPSVTGKKEMLPNSQLKHVYSNRLTFWNNYYVATLMSPTNLYTPIIHNLLTTHHYPSRHGLHWTSKGMQWYLAPSI